MLKQFLCGLMVSLCFLSVCLATDNSVVLKDVQIDVESKFYQKNRANWMRLKIMNASSHVIYLSKSAVGLDSQVPNFFRFVRIASGKEDQVAPYKGRENRSEDIQATSYFRFVPGDTIYLSVLLDDWYVFDAGECYMGSFDFVGSSIDGAELYTAYAVIGKVCPEG